MTPQQREEIESACAALQDDLDMGHLSWMSHKDVEVILQFARQQLNLNSGLPCCDCSREVVEFSVPNDVWNAVMRPDGKETDREYICLSCWHDHLRRFMSQRLNLRVDGERLIQCQEGVRKSCYALSGLIDECLLGEENFDDISTVVDFIKIVLSTRLDESKLIGHLIHQGVIHHGCSIPENLSALVLECLTTIPEEKE